MIKRTVSLFSLLSILALVLAACGGTPSAPTAPVAQESSAPSAATSAEPSTPAASAAPASEAAASEGAAPIGEADDGIMTVSVQQQPTWVRNFNPFSSAFLFPTVHGIYEPLMIYNVVQGELTP